jgi:hypothetical protein
VSTVPPEQPPPSGPTPPPADQPAASSAPEQPTQPTAAPPPVSEGPRTQIALNDIARMSVPGNAEFALWLFLFVVFTLIWWIDDDVASGQWMTVMTALSFGYFISRGIAKASRVLEH